MKYKVTIDQQTFEVEVEDLNALPILATVDGETFEVYPEAAAEAGNGNVQTTVAPVVKPAPVRVVPQEAPAPVIVSSAKAVTAPLPGTIVAIAVKLGDSVKQGQELLTLEAMKMKNAIRSPRAGTIAAVHVSVGVSVKHGQALVEFED